MTNKNNINKIKNIEYLKNIQIVCRNQEQVKNCLNYLEQLGFDVEDFTGNYEGGNIVYWEKYHFIYSAILDSSLTIEFYNKKFIKTLQKFIKEKEEKEEKEEVKTKDYEVAEDGRIIKINNYEVNEEIFFNDWNLRGRSGIEINKITVTFADYALKYGLAYATEEARDRAMFKLEIETKLKNIAEKLNAGRKIDWEDKRQPKFNINYDFIDYKKMYCNVNRHYKSQGTIYCLDENFLEVAKQEIGEENLIKYFEE